MTAQTTGLQQFRPAYTPLQSPQGSKLFVNNIVYNNWPCGRGAIVHPCDLTL